MIKPNRIRRCSTIKNKGNENYNKFVLLSFDKNGYQYLDVE
ncbi:hypothetical protein [Haloplasma contractile]|nr:hypothetical protein [Haloplasma contractile]